MRQSITDNMEKHIETSRNANATQSKPPSSSNEPSLADSSGRLLLDVEVGAGEGMDVGYFVNGRQ